MKIGLFLALLLAGCATEQPRFTTVSSAMPRTDAERDQECASIRSEKARLQSVMAAAATSQYALVFQAKARENIAALDSRAAQIQCDVIRVAPTTPAVPAKMTLEQCFAKCRELTKQTEAQCFDACK